MNLHQLTVFRAVVETGGFSKTAVELRLAQSAVGCPIKTLRRPLGIAITGSQLPTLYSTPVIYRSFDRLAWYFESLPIENRRRRPEMVPAD